MAFDIHISKRNILDDEGGGIEQADWIEYVEKTENLVWIEELPPHVKYSTNGVSIPLKRRALWLPTKESELADLCFSLGTDGMITFGLGYEDELLELIIKVASDLGGHVQADDGTYIREPLDVENIEWE